MLLFVCVCFKLKLKNVFTFRALYKILVFSDGIRPPAFLHFPDITFISDVNTCESSLFMSSHGQEGIELHKRMIRPLRR